MILRQVGKCGNVKMDAADALQGNSMAGDLHHHMGAACGAHPGKQPLQFIAFRSGALGGDGLLPDHVGHGTDEAHLRPQAALQHLLQKQCHGGLAVGAGNADHGHALGRMTVEIAAQESQGHPVAFHQNIGHIGFWLLCGNHRHSSLVKSHGDKSVSVRSKAGHRHKKAARGHFPGIIVDCVYIFVQVRGAFQHPDIL